jgi:GNAT superfamily N-acetyltransferase
VTIRRARDTDVPAILALVRGLAEYERLADQAVATEDDLRLTLFGPTPYAEVVLAEDERGVTGFALFFHNYSTFRGRPGLYLEDLFVIPERRGEGIGKALLLHLKDIAIERGCGRMEWSVLSWNEPAVGFYRRLGAVVMDDWRICRIDLP